MMPTLRGICNCKNAIAENPKEMSTKRFHNGKTYLNIFIMIAYTNILHFF
jgi:hypothetical protein